MKILIVDDEDLALATLEHALVRAGHQTVTARNGREALNLLWAESCHLVVSDWVMPEMNGLELCRQIRRMSFPGYVYVILLTSREGAENVIEGLSAGADDFITKPFNPDELCVRIRAGERVLALETRDVAIFAMAKLAESRDPETGQHLDRMRDYCRVLAEHLAAREAVPETVDEEYARLIYLTSPLHDIGKVGIPDSVLLKPGRLSDHEFEIMKTHTRIGAEALDAAARVYPGVGYLRLAREIALTHHERFDGSGYPSGLAGHDIPLCGRIVALADVYDALTTKRVYKEVLAHDLARNMILDEAGSHFDPAVIEAFVRNEEVFLSIKERFAEGSHRPVCAARETSPAGVL